MLIKESLATAYVKVCSHGSVSTTTTERAIKILIERLEYLKVTIGYAEVETLTALRQLVLLYQKLGSEEAHATITRLLLSTTTEIIIRVKSSKSLYEAAKIVGEI